MPHTVVWTPDKVASFWEVNHGLFSKRRFSQQVGPALSQFINRHVNLRGKIVMDYGCGDGALLKILRSSGAILIGSDFREPAGFAPLPTSQKEFRADQPYFVRDDSLSVLAGKADLVLLIEVVEHLEDEFLDAIIANVNTLLSPGGHLLVTTPHQEDLQANTVNCPDCGCVFHRVQHVRSWSAETLSRRFADAGLKQISVITTDLGRAQRSLPSRLLHTLLDTLDHRKMPHLVGLLQKPL
jgi:2-polyprenyl-3-methyl-5-hydroxy-6-metoxy-1,4-benzoquinol methylase